MVDHMMRRAALIAAAVMAAMPCATPANAEAAGAFIQTYVDARGGCKRLAPLLVFENGVANARAPFGKAAEDWTDDDIAALQRSMEACVRAPNRFDVSEERTILSKVAQRVSEARAARDARERQAAAAQETAENARRQQLVDDASRELQTFGGHIMSPAEVERAGELLDQFPNLSDDINDLLGAQDGLKQKASEERQREQERVAAAQRIAAEKEKQALDDKLQAEEAKVAAERERDAFMRALPSACAKAKAADAELKGKAFQQQLAQATALSEAGDVAGSCPTLKLRSAMRESLRASLVACAKQLAGDARQVGRQFATNALNEAIEIHDQQAALNESLSDAGCR